MVRNFAIIRVLGPDVSEINFAPVAQLDRVPGYELGGRTFESCRVRHTAKKSAISGFFGLYSELLPSVSGQFSPLTRISLYTSRSAQAYKAGLEVAISNVGALHAATVPIAMGAYTEPPARFQGYFEHLGSSSSSLMPERVPLKPSDQRPALPWTVSACLIWASWSRVGWQIPACCQLTRPKIAPTQRR